MNIEISPKTVLIKLLCIITFLLFVNILGIAIKLNFGQNTLRMLVLLFDFDTEVNIPSLYSSFALVVTSILLMIIAVNHKRKGSTQFYWFGLSIIFLFLSVDEIASVHERISILVGQILDTSGLFYYAWIIPYGLALLVFIAVYTKFLFNLPRKIMLLFVFSGITYVCGAIGFEMLGGRHAELYGEENLIFCIYYTCEEYLEMLGIVVFIHALFSYMASELQLLTITINDNRRLQISS